MKLLVRAPCCTSRRTCMDTAKYIIDLGKKEIIEVIPAVRCHRGLEKVYEIEVEATDSIAIVEHYTSNRGVNYLYFEYPKEPSPEIVDAVKEILGLKEMRKIIVK